MWAYCLSLSWKSWKTLKIAAFGVLAKSTKPRLPTHSLHPAWYQAKLIELSLYSSICARKKTEELRNKGEGGTEVGGMNSTQLVTAVSRGGDLDCWAEAPIKIARMILTIKLDGNWSSFQLANSAPPLSVTDSAIAPSARMHARSLHAQAHDCRSPLPGY